MQKYFPLNQSLLHGLSAAFFNRAKKLYSAPYTKFNISWLQGKFYQKAPKKKYIHKYKEHIHVAFYDPHEFLHAIKEIFVDELYLFKPKTQQPYIIDCGGYIGLSALFFKMYYPESKVLVFEPDAKNFAIAKENVDSWHTLKDITLVNKAIWKDNAGIEFVQTNDMSSTILKNADNHSNTSVVRVETQRLKDLLHTKVDFLKMDIEGAEYEVLTDAADSLQNVDHFFLEFHGFYDKMYELNTIFSILEKNKFKWYIKEANNVYPRPFSDKSRNAQYDLQLNIFAFKN